MHRACKLTFKHATASKHKRTHALLQAYRAAVNFFIRSLWENPGRLNKKTYERLPLNQTRLSFRYRDAALKQALEIVVSTRRSAKATGKWVGRPPIFEGAATLDAKFVAIEPSKNTTFDLCATLSTLRKGHRIVIPLNTTKILRKWLKHPGASLVQGCALSEETITLWVETPEEELKTEGRTLGIDIGVHKVIADSDGKFYGAGFKTLRNKINRKKHGSKAHKRAQIERSNYLNQCVNQLPWNELKAIGVEDLKGLKKGKQGRKSKKSFRKAMVPWTYRRVITRIQQRAQENRVRLVRVDPRNTSRRCSDCGTVSNLSRRGENYKCVICTFTADSDTNGALNVLDCTLHALRSSDSATASSVQSLGPIEPSPLGACHG